MKILIVDNHSELLVELARAMVGDVSVISWDELSLRTIRGFELIILSGASAFFPVPGNERKLFNEIELVRQSTVPVIGICYGAQVVARAFGAEILRMEKKHTGLTKIEVLIPDAVFDGRTAFSVFESHRFVIGELPPMLTALAKSEHGIEIIKHKTLPIWGLQFHPEHLMNKNEGISILKNIISQYEK